MSMAKLIPEKEKVKNKKNKKSKRVMTNVTWNTDRCGSITDTRTKERGSTLHRQKHGILGIALNGQL